MDGTALLIVETVYPQTDKVYTALCALVERPRLLGPGNGLACFNASIRRGQPWPSCALLGACSAWLRFVYGRNFTSILSGSQREGALSNPWASTRTVNPLMDADLGVGSVASSVRPGLVSLQERLRE